MAGLSGTLFALLAGALCYVSSPRQRLLRAAARPLAALVLAGLCVVVSAILWCREAGAVAGACATLGALAASLALMPFIGAYGRRDARPRHARGRTPDGPDGGADALSRGEPETL